MREKPKRRETGILNRYMMNEIAVLGGIYGCTVSDFLLIKKFANCNNKLQFAENVKEIEKNLEQDKSDLQANNNLKDEDTSLEQENEKENVYFGNLFEEKNEVTSEIIHEDKVKDKSKSL